MKHLTPKLILLAFMGLIMLASCEYDYYVFPSEPKDTTAIDTTTDTTGNDTTIVEDTISFVQDIIPFFNSSCVSCHKGSKPPDLRASKAYSSLINGNYVVAKQPDNSLLYTKCNTGGSMKVYTSASDLKLLKRWILAGAKNN
jgi:hypothetical protein